MLTVSAKVGIIRIMAIFLMKKGDKYGKKQS